MADAFLRILLCGDFADDEMRPVADFVNLAAPGANVRRLAMLPERGLSTLDGSANESVWSPDLIIIAQQRPDYFTLSAVRQLQAIYPLVRTVCCQGAWCESDGRNSTLWPDAVRVSARIAPSRIRRELDVLAGQHTALPLTASRDEIFEFDSPGDWISASAGKPVVVKSPDRALRRTIEALLTAGGFQLTQDENIEPNAIVWDVDPWGDNVAAEIDACCRKFVNARMIALMNFGHPHAIVLARESGIHAVVPKLCPADVLLTELTRHLQT